jgi:hypothetical protein
MVPRRRQAGWILTGALVSVLGTYLVVALVTLLFRFPVPFGGYVSGPRGVGLSLLAATIYGVVFGGFVLQGLLGGVAGWLACRRAGGEPLATGRLCLCYGLLAAAPGVALLATLDMIIGPW